jgi:uncharacterized protein involved in exopolysaccharide biosynthesis
MVAVLARNLPKTFVSESMIQIQPRDVPDNFVPDLISSSVGERVKSIEQTVMSRTNLLAIIREFGSQMPVLATLNIDEQVERLRGKIGIRYPVNPAKPTQQLPLTYFRISFSDQNRQLAQQIAQKLTLLFIAENNRMREEQVDGTRTFLKGELTRIGDDLRVAEERVKQLTMAHLGELPQKLDTNQRLLESSIQKSLAIDDALMKLAAQKQNYEMLIQDVPAEIPAKGFVMPAASNNSAPVIPGALKPPPESQAILDYRAAEKAYQDITAIHPPGYPDVGKLKLVRDRIRERLTPEELEIASKPPLTAAVTVPTTSGTTTPAVTIPMEPNPVYKQLQASLNTLDADRRSLLKQKSDIAESIATYERRIDSTPQVETQMTEFLRERNNLQKQYDDIQDNLSKADLSASLESQAKGQQFDIVDAANLPVDPTTPRRLFVVMGGAGASLLISVLFAVVVDIARQRVWTQKEIEAFWGVPVLVDIPEILTDTDLALARRKKWIFAGAAAGASVVYSICLYGVDLKHAFILRQLDPVLQKLIQ